MIIKEKLQIIAPSEHLFSSNMELYNTIIDLSVHRSDVYALVAGGKSVYLSGFDEHLILDRGEEIGLLWTGYNSASQKFTSAFNELVSFWLVPDRSLLSLQYFLGLEKEIWNPRRIKLLPINYLTKLPKSDVKILSKDSTITLGLWLDFDNGGAYYAKVFAFIRLLQFLIRLDPNAPMFEIKLLTYKRDTIVWNDLDIDPELLRIEVIEDMDKFLCLTDYYFSLEEESTVYDPMIQLVDTTLKMNWTYAPPRMDVILGNQYRELSTKVTIAINSLLSPGSQGLEPAAQHMLSFYEVLKQHIVNDIAVAATGLFEDKVQNV